MERSSRPACIAFHGVLAFGVVTFIVSQDTSGPTHPSLPCLCQPGELSHLFSCPSESLLSTLCISFAFTHEVFMFWSCATSYVEGVVQHVGPNKLWKMRVGRSCVVWDVC